MIADRKSFLYDMPSRTFYAALDPNYVGATPNTIEIPTRVKPHHITFHINNVRSKGIGFADVYESREPNSMPYYILLYKDANLMREHWRIARRAHD